MTLQTLESPVFPPKRDVSISSPKTQEESDFLRAVSARWRGRNPTRVPSLALGGPGPALLLSQSQGILSGLPCLGPLRLPHPPYNRVAMWSCRDWPGPEASNRNPSWSRPGPGCGLKDIRIGSQRQTEPGLRPQPHQTPGPLPTHGALPRSPDSTPRCPAACPAGRPPPQTLTQAQLPAPPSSLLPRDTRFLPAGFLGPHFFRHLQMMSVHTSNMKNHIELLSSPEASLFLLE